MAQFERPQTEKERKDFQHVDIKDHKLTFMEKNSMAEKAHIAGKYFYSPYDRVGARNDFDDQLKALIKTMQRNEGGVDVKEINKFIKNFSFEKYSDPKKWELIASSPHKEKVVINGVASMTTVGMWLNYTHTERYKTGWSVTVTKEQYDEVFGKKKGAKVETPSNIPADLAK